LNHFFVTVVKCPHLPTLGGWVLLLHEEGKWCFSLLMASKDGDKDLAATRELALNKPKDAAMRASEVCGQQVDRVTWLESPEDGRWVTAANLFAHHLEKNRTIARAGDN
jgi:hypothetical protein